jgi:hypothetical protein
VAQIMYPNHGIMGRDKSSIAQLYAYKN